MFGRYWRKFLAALGRVKPRYIWTLNVALWLSLGLSLGYQYLDRKIDEQHARYHYQPARDEELVRASPGQPKPRQYYPDCQAPVDREDSDLCAQWSAVEAVNESNGLATLNLWFSLVTLLMTAGGTTLLIWTLWETRQTARRELRAYITVEKVEALEATLSEFRARIHFVNRGATPAYIRDIAFGAWVGPSPLKSPIAGGAPPPISQALVKKVVGKDQGDSIHVWIIGGPKVVKETIRNANKKGFDLYVYGWIRYSDVFGADHLTAFSYIPPTDKLGTILPEWLPTISWNVAD